MCDTATQQCVCQKNLYPPVSNLTNHTCYFTCYHPTTIVHDLPNVIQTTSDGTPYCVCDAGFADAGKNGEGWSGASCSDPAEAESYGNTFSLFFGNTSKLREPTQDLLLQDSWQEAPQFQDSRVLLSDTVLFVFRNDLAYFLGNKHWPQTQGDPTQMFNPMRLQPGNQDPDGRVYGVPVVVNGTNAIEVKFRVGNLYNQSLNTTNVLERLQNQTLMVELCRASPECAADYDLLMDDGHISSSSDGFPWWLIIVIVVCALLCCCCLLYAIWSRNQKDQDPDSMEQLLRESACGKREIGPVPEYMNGSTSDSRTSQQSRASNGTPLQEQGEIVSTI